MNLKKMVLVVLFGLMVLSGCQNKVNTKVLDDINSNHNFTYTLTTEVTEEIESLFAVVPGFGVRIFVDPTIDPINDDIDAYMNQHETTFYYVTAYPDHSDEGDFITRIVTSDQTKYIYDLHVGDMYTKAELTTYLYTKGFKQHGEILNAYDHQGVRIRVTLVDDIIQRLSIEVIVTNRWGIIF